MNRSARRSTATLPALGLPVRIESRCVTPLSVSAKSTARVAAGTPTTNLCALASAVWPSGSRRGVALSTDTTSRSLPNLGAAFSPSPKETSNARSFCPAAAERMPASRPSWATQPDDSRVTLTLSRFAMPLPSATSPRKNTLRVEGRPDDRARGVADVPLDDEMLAVLSISTPIDPGIYWAGSTAVGRPGPRQRESRRRQRAPSAARRWDPRRSGRLAVITTIVGAAVGAKLILLVLCRLWLGGRYRAGVVAGLRGRSSQ
jgi:hypothetical protein